MNLKNSTVPIVFLYCIASIISLSATKLPRSINVTPILSNTSFSNTTITETNNTSTNLSTDPTKLPVPLPNITDETTSTSNFLNASRLFTIELTLSPALNPINESQTIKSVRNVLNGTITGKSLNGTILGGISNSISQWSNSTSSFGTGSSPSPPLPSFFIWMLMNGKNSSVFITQSSLPSLNHDQRLGRLTVEFENGKQFSKSLIFSTFGSQQNLTSFNFNDSLKFFIDAWGI